MENTRFKFRVFDDISNKYVNKGVLLRCGDLAIPTMKNDYDINPVDGRYSIEQCTGLKDKKGKLIYENDIVTDGKEIGRIYWYKTGWAVTMFLWQHDPSELEVIGNIHENPELLEDKEK